MQEQQNDLSEGKRNISLLKMSCGAKGNIFLCSTFLQPELH